MEAGSNSCIYGPVNSWRLGRSLGVDVLCIDSICSFACVYCQLGKINRLITERAVFVPTSRILSDLRVSDWRNSDIITFSGSGEPTLALNLGETIEAIRRETGKPIAVLTNSTMLGDKAVRDEIGNADRIYCKLDAWSDDVLRRIDRPAPGITLESIIGGIRTLRADFDGFLGIQTMILSQPDESEVEKLVSIYRDLGPNEVELNLPLRPVPASWNIESRGNVTETHNTSRLLKTITPDQAAEMGRSISAITGIRVITPFERTAKTNK